MTSYIKKQHGHYTDGFIQHESIPLHTVKKINLKRTPVNQAHFASKNSYQAENGTAPILIEGHRVMDRLPNIKKSKDLFKALKGAPETTRKFYAQKKPDPTIDDLLNDPHVDPKAKKLLMEVRAEAMQKQREALLKSFQRDLLKINARMK